MRINITIEDALTSYTHFNWLITSRPIHYLEKRPNLMANAALDCTTRSSSSTLTQTPKRWSIPTTFDRNSKCFRKSFSEVVKLHNTNTLEEELKHQHTAITLLQNSKQSIIFLFLLQHFLSQEPKSWIILLATFLLTTMKNWVTMIITILFWTKREILEWIGDYRNAA